MTEERALLLKNVPLADDPPNYFSVIQVVLELICFRTTASRLNCDCNYTRWLKKIELKELSYFRILSDLHIPNKEVNHH